MAETLLPFQCNHVEGLWKNTNKKKNTKPKREKVEKVQFFFPIYYFFFLTNSLVTDLKKVQNYLVLAEKRIVRTVHGFRNYATAVHTGPYFFIIQRFLRLKEPEWREVRN